MTTILRMNLLALGAIGVVGQASAQWRCDCTRIVGSCQAEAAVEESFIEVTTSAEQCARVDYFVDGIPFVALVVEGVERQDWIVRTENPNVIVQSCQVCLDNAGDESAAQAAASGTGEPTRLLEVAPTYPAAAAAAGTEGYVELRFTVSPLGTPSDIEIVAAEPEGVFDQAALAAVARWRYSPGDPDSPQTVTERVEFDLSDAIFAQVNAAQERDAAASREPVLNNCIREEASYDFGAMVDVSLINACEQPLVVHSCSAGVGASSRQWICGEGDLSMAGSLELTRAPNSEYWWLACSVDDVSCQSDGQQWVRSMHRQLASINPQDRTRARLARSY